ncbi:MAG: hypothetical protein M1504_00435 [Candidatus Marsarchaeota archaeon]|nr:hypothetical protein [Candidatus Marsarchaeota archaeon]
MDPEQEIMQEVLDRQDGSIDWKGKGSPKGQSKNSIFSHPTLILALIIVAVAIVVLYQTDYLSVNGIMGLASSVVNSIPKGAVAPGCLNVAVPNMPNLVSTGGPGKYYMNESELYYILNQTGLQPHTQSDYNFSSNARYDMISGYDEWYETPNKTVMDNGSTLEYIVAYYPTAPDVSFEEHVELNKQAQSIYNAKLSRLQNESANASKSGSNFNINITYSGECNGFTYFVQNQSGGSYELDGYKGNASVTVMTQNIALNQKTAAMIASIVARDVP